MKPCDAFESLVAERYHILRIYGDNAVAHGIDKCVHSEFGRQLEKLVLGNSVEHNTAGHGEHGGGEGRDNDFKYWGYDFGKNAYNDGKHEGGDKEFELRFFCS